MYSVAFIILIQYFMPKRKKRNKANGNPGNPGTKPSKKNGGGKYQNLFDIGNQLALHKEVSNDNFPQRVQGGVIELAPQASSTQIASMQALLKNNEPLQKTLEQKTGSNSVVDFVNYFKEVAPAVRQQMVMQSRLQLPGNNAYEQIKNVAQDAASIYATANGKNEAGADYDALVQKRKQYKTLAIVGGVIVLVIIAAFLLLKGKGTKKQYV